MPASRASILATALLISASCGDGGSPPGSTCPNPIYDGEIVVAATSKTMLIDAHVGAQVAEAGAGIRVDIQDNQGTVTFGGGAPAPAIIYRRVPWQDTNVTLLSGIGVTDGAWLLFWLYCSADGIVDRFYGERTDATMVWDVNVAGSCDQLPMLWEMPVELPAHTLRNLPMSCGFEVSNPSWDTPLSLRDSAPGTATLQGLPASAIVFATADCRTKCPRPFYELHSVLWEPTGQQAAFAIWYLESSSPGMGVHTANGLLLPAAGWTDMTFQNATWTLDR